MLAREAAEQLELECVLLVVTGEAPHKRIEPEPGAEVRLEMVREAVAGDDVLEASAIEVELEGPSYTFRTLELLSERRPDDELSLLMGADVAAGLGSWREPERVVELARVGVAGRPGTEFGDAEAVLERFGARDTRRVRMPQLEVSSTDIRERAGEGRSIRYLVPEAVARVIDERGLYREAVRA